MPTERPRGRARHSARAARLAGCCTKRLFGTHACLRAGSRAGVGCGQPQPCSWQVYLGGMRQGGMRRRGRGACGGARGDGGRGGGGCAGTPGAATPAAGGGRPHMRTWIPECLKAAAENEFGAWEWGKQRGLARLPCGGGAGAAAVRWGRANAWVGSSGGPVRPWRPAVWASAAPCWADAWACWCCTPVAAALLCVTRGQRRG